jgi:hypothetical protein
VIIVGGLAVICRLSTPYRATTDLDTVNRRRHGEPAQLEVLLATPGATASGPAGALVPDLITLVSQLLRSALSDG